jgi:deoxyribodipyrimidine photo-lyase
MIDLIWLKNDLRIEDNPSLNSDKQIIVLYIISEKIHGYAQWWTLNSLMQLEKKFQEKEIPFIVTNEKNFEKILYNIKNTYGINLLKYNKSYESYWISMEQFMNNWANENQISLEINPSNTLLNPQTIFNKTGQNYKVFTPFWKHIMTQDIPKPFNGSLGEGWNCSIKDIDIAQEYQEFFKRHSYLNQYWKPGEENAHKVLENFIKTNLKKYKDGRNFPATPVTSKLSPHLRSGEITSRQIYWMVKNSKIDDELTEPFLRQLGWREFSFHLLAHYPHMNTENLHREYDGFPWNSNDKYLHDWKMGMTGYPIIDAGMRELKSTGWLHNRLRLIIGSFLTKDLRLHWTQGAEHFWEYLMDADEANNSASWQWVAGCGMDAAPYYRIFNPVLQSMKFDPNGIYIKQWIPELRNIDPNLIHDPWSYNLSVNGYPKPILNHKMAKQTTLDLYFNFFKKEKGN